jgi:DNA polymerase-3 subunit alpha
VSAPPFVHLHLHGHYSFLRSTIRLPELCARAAELGMGAVAVTDDANLFGAFEFCEEARKAGLKPILGADIWVAEGSMHEKPEQGAGVSVGHRLVLLVKDAEGWRNLGKLLSMAYLEGFHRKPRVDEDALARHAGGLIALSGGAGGLVPIRVREGRLEDAEAAAQRLRDIFGTDGFYLELQDHGRPEQREFKAWAREAGARLGIDLVATNDPHFLDAEGLEAHRALTCIGTGTTLDDKPVLDFTPNHHFRTAEQMAELFADVPEALANTLSIAERCNYSVERREPMMPDFEVPAGETLETYFRRVCAEGLDRRLTEADAKPESERPEHPREDYQARLELELDVICQMGYPGYFLITWDLIRHAREQDIPVGPGRGSAAGSVVAWCLSITDVDPLKYGLLFERFLNPERKSLPDIDMDFCQRRRGEVIRYVQEKYGKDRVAQIITFGTLSAKSVIRDVGRVMNMTFGEVDRIAKLVPDELGVKLAKALEDSPQLAEAGRTDERVGKLLHIAQQLEGLARNPGVHAAGVIIAPSPLDELVPLFRTNKDEVVTQFAKDEGEAIGLLKMDFLGLKTLTVLHDALKAIERSGHGKIVLETLPLDDEPTFELFRQARTSGVFQFESSGMREVLRKLQPVSYDDLTALNALYRPGPLQSGMVDDYIERRHGRQKVTYPHEALEKILEPTYGTLVFQEQVMQAAVEMAGFSLAQADNLRKAMGKKKVEVMAAQKKLFVEGAAKGGIPTKKSAEVFELMEKFAAYGFNKSHSAAYALVAYWCGYLKAHHPAHFMAALLTSDRDNTSKVVRYIAECRELSIEVLPPDVNESDVDFTAVGPRTIRFGLSAIKGVGRSAVKSILEARERAGRFEELYGYCAEIDLRLNNKKVLEALVKAGALDSLGGKRSALMAALEPACEAAASVQSDRLTGQSSLFDTPGLIEDAPARGELPVVPEWPDEDRLRYEKEVLGFYVSGHPLERHVELLESLTSSQLTDLAEHGGQEVTVAGIVTSLRKMRTKKGDWMAFLQLEDLTGHAEVVVFPKAWEVCADFIEVDAPLCVKGQVEAEGDSAKILAEELQLLGQAEEAAASSLVVELPPALPERELDELLGRTDDLLAGHPGTCPVRFRLLVPEVGAVTVAAGMRFAVKPDSGLLSGLEALVGDGKVHLTYR